MDIKKLTDFTKKYSCNECDTTCSRESEWQRHLLTRKHITRVTGNGLDTNGDTKKKEHICSQCNKIYLTNGYNNIGPK